MDREEFEQLVNEGLDLIPERFLKLLDNVGIVVDDEPNAQQRRKLNLRGDMTLFGLYEGVPQSRRGPNYTAVLPDKITIFQKPIELAGVSPENIRQIVADTVWHEIAHHFGMDEHEVRHAEHKKRKRS